MTTFERADYEFTRDAMVLSYTNKAGSEIFKIGINTHDKRPELIKVKITEKKQKQTESSTKESSTQTSTESSTESSTEESETERSTERRRRGGGGGGGENNHHESQPEKKPSQDLVNNGGAGSGGGNATVGTDAFEATDPAVRTDGGHEKPEKVKPENPTNPDKDRNIKESEAAYENRKDYATETQPQSAEYRDKNGVKVDDIDIAEGNDVLDEGHEKPANVKPETPTPDQSHQNVETQKTDEIKMNYETEAQRNDNFTNNKGETINHGVDNSGKSLQKDDYVGFVNSDDEEPK